MQGQRYANDEIGELQIDGCSMSHKLLAVDKVFFIRGEVLNLASQFDHGSIVGPQGNFVVDQGLGYNFFNRHTATVTRHYPLPRLFIIG